MEGQEWTWEDNEGLGESSGAHLRPRREMRDTDSRDTGKAGWTDGQNGLFLAQSRYGCRQEQRWNEREAELI